MDGQDENGKAVFLKRIDTLIWLYIDKDSGFVTLVRKSEIQQQRRHKVILPKPVRTVEGLRLLLKVLGQNP